MATRCAQCETPFVNDDYYFGDGGEALCPPCHEQHTANRAVAAVPGLGRRTLARVGIAFPFWFLTTVWLLSWGGGRHFPFHFMFLFGACLGIAATLNEAREVRSAVFGLGEGAAWRPAEVASALFGVTIVGVPAAFLSGISLLVPIWLWGSFATR